MKKFIPLISISTIIAFSCAKDQKATIRFCDFISLNEPCIGESTEFLVKSKVWVLLKLNTPSNGETITGNLYALNGNKKVFIGAQDFKLDPGESYAIDYMVFNDRGEFMVEFINEEGNSLVKKRIKIL